MPKLRSTIRKPILRKYAVTEGAEIRSLSDAFGIASSEKSARKQFVVYRGQSNWGWILRPKAFRKPSWYRHERDMVRELISTHPQEFVGDSLMLDRLVRMQHYGLPTRLLDVTTNFLAALYFACEPNNDAKKGGGVFIIRGEQPQMKYYDSDAVSLVANLSNLSEDERLAILKEAPENNDATPQNDAFNTFPAVDRLLQFVRGEKPYFVAKARKDDLRSTFCVMPKKNNRRIIAQSGAFLIFGLVERDRNPDLKMFEITRHRVQSNAKEKLRFQLAALGVTEGSLYPELDHAALYIAGKFARN